MTYLAHPAHYTPGEFRTMVRGLKFAKGWKPEFPTLHNTGVPSLKQWQALGSVPQERWGANLNGYYKSLGWHAGPHLVVCPDYIWNLCDLEEDGVSVSCWNKVTLGIEMVGNFEVGGDDFASGAGAKVRDNAVWTLAVLCERFGWKIEDVLRFHRECAKDHHACPGSKVSKPEIIQRVHALLETWGHGGTPIAAHPVDDTDPGSVGGIAWAQSRLNALGFARPKLTVDGDAGKLTANAIGHFQSARGLFVDGILGPRTVAALTAAPALVGAPEFGPVDP